MGDKPKLYYNSACPVCRSGIEQQRAKMDEMLQDGSDAIAWCDIAATPEAAVEIDRSVDQIRHSLHMVDGDGRLLVGATVEEAGFDKRTVPSMIQHQHQAALELLPKLREAKILEDWAGLRPGTPDGLPILGETVNTSGHVCIIGDSPVIQETDASYRVADPEATRRRREQGVQVGREESFANRGSERFESRSIKLEQPVGSAQPKEAVMGLCQTHNVWRRAVLEGPGLVTHLQGGCSKCLWKQSRAAADDQ